MNRWREASVGLITVALSLVTAAWVIGQIWRDTTLFTALCFYIPSPALVVTLLVGALIQRKAKRRLSATLLASLAILPFVSIALIENRLLAAEADLSAEEPLRVVHWNVMWGKRGWPEIAEQLLELDADAYLLSEVGYYFDYSAFEDYEVAGDWGMAIIARGELGQLKRHYNTTEIREIWIDWRPQGVSSDDKPLRLMLADISAQLRLHRRPTIKLLRRSIAEFRPDLVVGDFNAPRLSRGLSPPPVGYRHAYDTAGSGWSYTWPTPIPMLAIDQLLYGRRCDARAYRLETSWLSDHRRQVFEIDFSTSREQR